MSVTAVEKLKPSRLSNQRELLGNDVDLEQLNLARKGAASRRIRELVVDGEIERTIEGASTVTLNLNDRDHHLLRSRYLGKEIDIKIDGLWFRLVAVDKDEGAGLTLTFEDREVAILRKYAKPRVASATKVSRAEFARLLVNEVRELDINFVCPALKRSPEIRSSADRPDPTKRNVDRAFGFAPGAAVKVKRADADPDQLRNIDRVLQVGVSMVLPRKLLVCAVMTITQESTARNLTGGDRDSVGLFQQRPSQGWPASRDIERDARAFYEKAVAIHRGRPNLAYDQLCQLVQISAYPTAYAAWRTEADRTVAAWGIPAPPVQRVYDKSDRHGLAEGTTITSSAGSVGAETDATTGRTSERNVMAANNSAAAEFGADTSPQFTRGSRSTENGRPVWKTEHTWACLGRLAEEVNWDRFMVSGSLYFISEAELFQSKPQMTIREDTLGVHAVTAKYDVGRPNASVTVRARISRWAAPPGSTVTLDGFGVLDGRWIVERINRPVFSAEGTITLRKPRPVLPEWESATFAGSREEGGEILGDTPSSDTGGGVRDAIVAAAERALIDRDNYRYRQVRPIPDSLFGPYPLYTDCSGFATLVYKAAGAPDPNGFGYNGAGYTGTLVQRGTWTQYPQPGDLAFYRGTKQVPGDVRIYIGGGQTIGFGHDPIDKHPAKTADLLGYQNYPLTPQDESLRGRRT